MTPQHLFKIISMEHWEGSKNKDSVKLSKEDEKFIHLAKDEQLDKIIDKYWANSEQFAVLKLDTSKLKGKLVFETNPGGKNKYYHLYDGAIPTMSVIEVRKVERRNTPSQNTLKVVQIGEPVLRTPAEPLTKEEILSKEIQNLIVSMKETMRAAPGVGLAAPQIGKSLQIIVIEDRSEYHSRWTAEQLAERERVPVPFHVLINPVLHITEADTVEFFEGCMSIPGLMGVVPRAKAVRVEGLNENAQKVVIEARGWYARILQHEVDHLKGVLNIDRVKTRTLSTFENFDLIWKGKPVAEALKVMGDNK